MVRAVRGREQGRNRENIGFENIHIYYINRNIFYIYIYLYHDHTCVYKLLYIYISLSLSART